MGEDPFLASIMVVPYIQGLQYKGVSACVKHYYLNNDEEYRHQVNVNVSDTEDKENASTYALAAQMQFLSDMNYPSQQPP